MAKKASHRDILIEQCIQDARYERLDEGWWDDIKANVRGVGEWLKQDAKDSFKLRKKNDVKNNRRYARTSGKVKSYASSLAKTMSDYKRSGGTLGQDIENIDDAINRLNQVAKGQFPRGLNRKQRVSQYSSGNSTERQPSYSPKNISAQTTASSKNSSSSNLSGSSNISSGTNNSRNNGNTTGKSLNGNNLSSSTPNTSSQVQMLNSINDKPRDNNSKAEPTKKDKLARAKNIRKIGKKRAAEESKKKAEKIKRDKQRRIRRGEEESLGQRALNGIKKLFKKKSSQTRDNAQNLTPVENIEPIDLNTPKSTDSKNKASDKIPDARLVGSIDRDSDKSKNEIPNARLVGPINRTNSTRKVSNEIPDARLVSSINKDSDKSKNEIPNARLVNFDNIKRNSINPLNNYSQSGSLYNVTDKGDAYIGNTIKPFNKNKKTIKFNYEPDDESVIDAEEVSPKSEPLMLGYNPDEKSNVKKKALLLGYKPDDESVIDAKELSSKNEPLMLGYKPDEDLPKELNKIPNNKVAKKPTNGKRKNGTISHNTQKYGTQTYKKGGRRRFNMKQNKENKRNNSEAQKSMLDTI